MRNSVSPYHRHRFPAQIISHSVWLYFRFALSFRDVEEMLAMRGVTVSYETVREWCLLCGPDETQSCVLLSQLAGEGRIANEKDGPEPRSRRGREAHPPL